jgi:hypothetical protein
MERAMKKRPRRKSAKPPPQRPRSTGRRPGTRSAAARVPAAAPGPLQYKVVELSTVDEGALERTLNTWTAQGWNLDGVQFAMRESSKRPAMAFVFFTREGPAAELDPAAESGQEEARGRLRRLAESGSPTLAVLADLPLTPPPARAVSAHERLAQLAGLDEPEAREEGLTLDPDAPDWSLGADGELELDLGSDSDSDPEEGS